MNEFLFHFCSYDPLQTKKSVPQKPLNLIGLIHIIIVDDQNSFK